MRSILIALTFGVAAASIAYAHTTDGAQPMREAGTLSCRTRPELGLVFGRTPVAACTFLAAQGGAAQTYAALLAPRAEAEDAARTLAWRVMTPGGTNRSGMLDGDFAPAGAAAALRGRAAGLEPLDASGEVRLTLGAVAPQVAFGSLAPAR